MITLPRSLPEAQGVASSAVLDLVNALTTDGQELHSLMVVRKGAVIAEGWWAPYAPEHTHMLYSLSKSFASTAAGLAVGEKYFTLDDKVISFFPDELPADISENLAAMRVRDLLAMATGNETEPSRWNAVDGNWVRNFLAHPVPFAPGTHFLYNSMATYMVSAIVQKSTGQDLLEFLGPRLFAPLGIAPPMSERCPKGIPVGGWGLNLHTEDIAKFGQLYLQDGIWEGKRLLPEGWVVTATSKQVENGAEPTNDWNQGYGFQFWRCQHNAYRGDGAFGQYCVVMPDQETVVAITSRVNDMGLVLKQIWEVLLPALGETPLADDPAGQSALSARLASLSIPTQTGAMTSPISSEITGKQYSIATNDWKIETITVLSTGENGRIDFTIDGASHTVEFGHDNWLPGTLPFLPYNTPTVATGAWTNDDTLSLKVCFIETPFVPTVTLRFTGEQMTIDVLGSLGFGPKEWPTLHGKTVPSAP